MKEKSIFNRDIVLVMVVTLLCQCSMMGVNPLITSYAEQLGASSSYAGLIVGSMSVASMFLRPVAGNLSDRFSKFLLTYTGAAISFVGVGGYILAPNAHVLLICRIINGTGVVFCTVCMATWLALLVPRSEVGKAMGYYGLLNAISMALAPFATINLYRIIGYRPTLGLSALANFLMLVIMPFIKNHGAPIKSEKAHKGLKIKLLQKNTIPVALIISLLSIPYFATQADLVTYVIRKHLTIAVGSFFLVYAVVVFVVRIVFKDYFDTVAYGFWLWSCSIASAVCLVLLSVMKNNWEMGLAAAFMALGYGVLLSESQSTGLLLAPLSEQGLANATIYLGLDIGMALGPVIGGLLFTYVPLKFFYPSMLLIVPLAIIIYLLDRSKLNSAIKNH